MRTNYSDDYIDYLYSVLTKLHKAKVVSIIIGCVFGGIAALLLILIPLPVPGVICIICGLLSMLVALLLGGACQRTADKIYRCSPEYQSEIEHAQEREAEIAQAQHPQCPACHGYKTRRIPTSKRVVSVATIGIASSTIGKQYECLECLHKW